MDEQKTWHVRHPKEDNQGNWNSEKDKSYSQTKYSKMKYYKLRCKKYKQNTVRWTIISLDVRNTKVKHYKLILKKYDLSIQR